MKKRGFQIVSKYKGQGIHLPFRSTSGSVGYDLESAVDIWIPSMFLALLHGKRDKMRPVLVPTGIKAYCPSNEWIEIANRSSNPLKRHLYLSNSIGVIDSDYYNNPDNEGEIYIQLENWGPTGYHIKKHQRIAQAIFRPALFASDDHGNTNRRKGGLGSTGK